MSTIQKPFTLSVSKCRGNQYNTSYPNVVTISSIEDLKAAAQFDHIGAVMENNNRRKVEDIADAHFLWTDVYTMDCDNDHSDNPEDWKAPADLQAVFPGVQFYVSYSKSHMKEKNGKAARPKWHVFFPLSERNTDRTDTRRRKRQLHKLFPYFDGNALNALRVLTGVENPHDPEFYPGDKCIDEVLPPLEEIVPIQTKGRTSFAPSGTYERDFFLEALDRIPCCELSRENWISVGMAIKRRGYDFHYFDEWSATDPRRYDARQCEKDWNSFTETGAITSWTVFRIAADYGYHMPTKEELSAEGKAKARKAYEREFEDSMTALLEAEPPLTRKELDAVNDFADEDQELPTVDPETGEIIEDMETDPAWESLLRMKYPLIPDDYSDAGQADLFSYVFRNVMRYCAANGGWMVYDGKVWNRDPEGAQVMRLSKMLSKMQLDESEKMLEDAEKELLEAADACGVELSTKQLAKGNIDVTMLAQKALLEECLSDPDKMQKQAIAFYQAWNYNVFAEKRRAFKAIKETPTSDRAELNIDITAFDADPFTLNTPAGEIDLRTGKLRRHRPESYCSRITSASPGTDGAEEWEAFINKIMAGDPDMIHYLQLTAGQRLIGRVDTECLEIHVSSGGTGKSSYNNSMLDVVGSYGSTIDTSVLMSDDKSNNNVLMELMSLRGVRYVLAAETAPGKQFSTDVLKKLVKTDRIRGRNLYREFTEFKPTHHLTLFTNVLPSIGTSDAGTWDSVRIVPFNVRIRGTEDEILNYGNVLAENCGPAILSWMVDGARELVANRMKIPVPLKVQEETARYRGETDWLWKFLNSECIFDPEAVVPARNLLTAYDAWSIDRGYTRVNDTEFGRRLTSTGMIHRKRVGRDRILSYTGIRLKADAAEAEEFLA